MKQGKKIIVTDGIWTHASCEMATWVPRLRPLDHSDSWKHAASLNYMFDKSNFIYRKKCEKKLNTLLASLAESLAWLGLRMNMAAIKWTIGSTRTVEFRANK